MIPTSPSVAPIASSCASVRLRELARDARGRRSGWPPAARPRPAPRPRSRLLVEVAEVDHDPQLGAAARPARGPAAVSPGPVSGLDGKMKGTPWPNALERLHTGPSDRSPAAYQCSSASSSGSIASAPSMCSTAAGWTVGVVAHGVEVGDVAGDPDVAGALQRAPAGRRRWWPTPRPRAVTPAARAAYSRTPSSRCDRVQSKSGDAREHGEDGRRAGRPRACAADPGGPVAAGDETGVVLPGQRVVVAVEHEQSSQRRYR